MKPRAYLMGLLFSVAAANAVSYTSPDGDQLQVRFHQDNWFLYLEVTPIWGGEPKYNAVNADGDSIIGGSPGYTSFGYLPESLQGFFGPGVHNPNIIWEDAVGDVVRLYGASYTIQQPTGPRPAEPEEWWHEQSYSEYNPALITTLSPLNQVPDGGSTALLLGAGLLGLVLIRKSCPANPGA